MGSNGSGQLGVGIATAMPLFLAIWLWDKLGADGIILMVGTFAVLVMIFFALWGNSNKEDPLSMKDFGSMFNFKKQLSGYAWTTISALKKEGKKPFEINKFVTFPQYYHEPKKVKFLQNVMKKINLKVTSDYVDLRKSILAFGAPSSGKTYAFESWLQQVIDSGFNKIRQVVFYDVKGSSFSKMGRKEDIILSLYDKRGTNWNIWADMQIYPTVIQKFFVSMVKMSTGEAGKSDFFVNSAAKQLSDIVFKVYYEFPNLNDCQRYFKVLELLDSWKNQDINKDVALTLALSLDIIELMAYRFTKDPKNNFSIVEFYETSGRVLWMLDNAAFKDNHMPFFSGFATALTTIKLAGKDNDKEFTMYVIDEITSFDIQALSQSMVQIRSRGGILIFGSQFMIQGKMKQLLDNSKYITMIFNVDDEMTVEWGKKMLGNVTYQRHNQGAKDTKGQKTYTSSEGKEGRLDEMILRSMPQYHCVTFIKKSESNDKNYLLYFGKVGYPVIAKNDFEEQELLDLHDFYANFRSRKKMNSYRDKKSLSQMKKLYDEIIKASSDKLHDILVEHHLEDEDLDVYFAEVRSLYGIKD